MCVHMQSKSMDISVLELFNYIRENIECKAINSQILKKQFTDLFFDRLLLKLHQNIWIEKFFNSVVAIFQYICSFRWKT